MDMGTAGPGLGLQVPARWSELASTYRMAPAKPQKEQKFKSQCADDLMNDLSRQLLTDKFAKHSCLSKHPDGSLAIVPAAGGMGKMQCDLCHGKPTFDAGKCAHGTLKHLASPTHFAAWYAKKHQSELSKREMQDVYNQFAHGMSMAKCACEMCRPAKVPKRVYDTLLPIAPGRANEPRAKPTTPVVAGGLGDVDSWRPGTTEHATTRSY